uniref:Short coiled-coil protein A n=1 Tax=Schistocephalus solidus TaxID=70667 RepID=A0A0X3PTU2_SCHSO
MTESSQPATENHFSDGQNESADYVVSYPNEFDENLSESDREEKRRLIKQVLELQHTLADLSARVESVKEENMNLRSENQILGQYIEKLMISSPVFHSSSPPTVERNKRANQLPAAAAAGAATPSSGLGLQTFPFEENSGVVSEEEFP